LVLTIGEEADEIELAKQNVLHRSLTFLVYLQRLASV
jgi:hypothetical protein